MLPFRTKPRRSKMSSSKLQILLIFILTFFTFIYFYTIPENLDDLESQIAELNKDNEIGKTKIDKLEVALQASNIENILPQNNVSYVVFNRVPKCGSMFLTTLCYKLGKINKFTVESPYEDGEKPQKSMSQQSDFVTSFYNMKKPNLYIRHQWFINFEDFDQPNPIYINMIRDPISRFESFYYFSRFGNHKGGGGGAHQHDDIIKNESVDDCVRKRRKECLMPYWQIVPYFCGNDKRCAERGQWATDMAKTNIERYYLFVGTLEDLEGSLRTLSHLLPDYFANALETSKEGASVEMKEGTGTKNKKETSEETKLFLKTETSLKYEYQLYDFVRHRLEAMKIKFGLDEL